MRFGRLVTLLLLAPIAPAQQEPTFGAGTHLVQVDAIVRKGSNPVAGLTKEDFTLLDNGNPQRIDVFAVRSARNPASTAAPLPPRTFSNRLNSRGETPATATILLIDRLNTQLSEQPYVNAKVVKFLKTRGNRDAVGIYTLGTKLRIIQDLTSDSGRLDRAVKMLKPEDVQRLRSDVETDSTGDTDADAMTARALEGLEDITLKDTSAATREAMQVIAGHVAGVPGRKNLIWISDSFPLLSHREHYELDLSPEVVKAARSLGDANVAIYPVDARGLIGTLSAAGSSVPSAQTGPGRAGPQRPRASRPAPGGPSGADTMNMLAGLTGGRAFYDTNGIDESIGKAIEDSEVVYTLGFYPPPEKLDGTYHKLRVKVSTGGASVHYRESYLAVKTGQPDRRPSLAELIKDPLDATGIGLLARAASDQSKPASYQVTVSVDLHDLQLAHENARWTGEVDVSLFVDGSGNARTLAVKFDIPDAQFAAAREKGIEVVDSIDAPAKVSELRIVAQDRATGAVGSLWLPLAAR